MSEARGQIGIGLSLPTWPLRDGSYASWPQMRRLAQAIEALGVDTLWVPDHLQRVTPKRGTFGFWECWTILTAAAEATSRIEIGHRKTSLKSHWSATAPAMRPGYTVVPTTRPKGYHARSSNQFRSS